MSVKSYVRQHLPLVSISLFLVIFGIIQSMMPAFLYNSDGSLKEFGVGYKNKGDVYRPTIRINNKTPTTFNELTQQQIKKAQKEKKTKGGVKQFSKL